MKRPCRLLGPEMAGLTVGVESHGGEGLVNEFAGGFAAFAVDLEDQTSELENDSLGLGEVFPLSLLQQDPAGTLPGAFEKSCLLQLGELEIRSWGDRGLRRQTGSGDSQGQEEESGWIHSLQFSGAGDGVS